MLIVTGGIACGKSTFLKKAVEMGYACVDADDWFQEYKHKEPIASEVSRLFGDYSLADVAFRHQSWKMFIEFVDQTFLSWLNDQNAAHGNHLDILVVPDFFSRNLKLGKHKVLTIERPNNMYAALTRDTHRIHDLTLKIHKSQMSFEERIIRSDFVINNTGSKEQFERDCEKWLRSHLPAALTRHTTDTSTL